MTIAEIAERLADGNQSHQAALFAEARRVCSEVGRSDVLPRGLIEVGNRCSKNCLYCGIRRDNRITQRYRMTEDEVRAAVGDAVRRGYPAVAFQSGELAGEENSEYVERLLSIVSEFDRRDSRLEVTLSLGEQTRETYARWLRAADGRVLRYLIRIETSDPVLFAKIHGMSDDRAYRRRLECIRTLKELGYVTGSGVMIGLPGQTFGSLAQDIDFFRREKLDMVGMGPYVPTPGTPLAESVSAAEVRTLPSWTPALRLAVSLRMIALTRIAMRNVNIVAASALEALAADGRERGLAAGANVIMPVLTPDCYRSFYSLYPGKESHGRKNNS